MVGTGSTGVQVAAELGGKVGHLTHFVRTPQWIAPFPNKRYSRSWRAALRGSLRLNGLAYRGAQTILERTFGTAVVQPGWQRRLLTAVIRLHLRRVRDPELRAQAHAPTTCRCASAWWSRRSTTRSSNATTSRWSAAASSASRRTR